MTAKSALLLTEEEWAALRDIANAYLANTAVLTANPTVVPIDWREPMAKRRVLCERIMEAT